MSHPMLPPLRSRSASTLLISQRRTSAAAISVGSESAAGVAAPTRLRLPGSPGTRSPARTPRLTARSSRHQTPRDLEVLSALAAGREPVPDHLQDEGSEGTCDIEVAATAGILEPPALALPHVFSWRHLQGLSEAETALFLESDEFQRELEKLGLGKELRSEPEFIDGLDDDEALDVYDYLEGMSLSTPMHATVNTQADRAQSRSSPPLDSPRLSLGVINPMQLEVPGLTQFHSPDSPSCLAHRLLQRSEGQRRGSESTSLDDDSSYPPGARDLSAGARARPPWVLHGSRRQSALSVNILSDSSGEELSYQAEPMAVTPLGLRGRARAHSGSQSPGPLSNCSVALEDMSQCVSDCAPGDHPSEPDFEFRRNSEH
eukprot:CAMPEP_0114546418 /NCGR_PEP_ID=MMETSP0114-20121206/3924_1 /TAXON_ID=31324 /ORGANISM="Goniomonas sp, Strain m" /LENGTH=373 /DNA_ID=CAMNT_0001730913 /DNA_START=201 /DNA_END=1322 /DNA_ORIENTATION=+